MRDHRNAKSKLRRHVTNRRLDTRSSFQRVEDAIQATPEIQVGLCGNRILDAGGEIASVNSLVKREFPLLEQTLALRTQLIDILTDADLGHVLPVNPSLGELCCEAGQHDEIYIESFRTFVLDWTPRHAPHGAQTQVEVPKERYASSDDSLKAALTALSEEDIQGKTIDRQGYAEPVGVQFHIYRESVLIFCGKASVYLRALGKRLPPQRQQWIG